MVTGAAMGGQAVMGAERPRRTYPFLYGVGLTDGPLRCRDAAGDAAVALAHAPKLAADFLLARESREQTMRQR